MNIYLHVEVSVRELDSKILLAVLAASKGHQVIISDLNTLKKGVVKGLLSPGIFHTKSLTPNDEKMGIHKELVNNGFKITSIDEEGVYLSKVILVLLKSDIQNNQLNRLRQFLGGR